MGLTMARGSPGGPPAVKLTVCGTLVSFSQVIVSPVAILSFEGRNCMTSNVPALVATVGLEGYVLTKGMPSEVPDIVAGRILGTLDMAFGTVLAFWLGSSRGSQVKDSALANAAAK